MSESTQVVTVNLEISVSIGDQRKIRTSIQIEGDADVVNRASGAVMAVITAAASGSTPALPTPTVLPAAVAMATLPAQPAVPIVPIGDKAPPTNDSHRQNVLKPQQPSKLAQRDWSKFSLGFGALLVIMALAVAVVFPPVVPRGQRLDVFMMSLAFGLLGTLALYSGALGEQSGQAARVTRSASASARDLERITWLRKNNGRPLGSSLWGIVFGGVFIVAGAIAPFSLGNGNPDERFLMMLGFAPVVVVGVILVTVFWRRITSMNKSPARMAMAATHSIPVAIAPRTVRAPVTRAPNDAAFKFGVPAALATLGVVLLIVIGLVVVATLLPLLR